MGMNWLLSFVNTIQPAASGGGSKASKAEMEKIAHSGFQMPLHYPRYVRSDYEKMDEERIDLLLRQYGLSCSGDLEEKRNFAIGAFVWPDQI